MEFDDKFAEKLSILLNFYNLLKLDLKNHSKDFYSTDFMKKVAFNRYSGDILKEVISSIDPFMLEFNR